MMRLGIILAVLSIGMIPAYAQNYCWEDETDMCGLISSNPADIFGAIMDPLETQVGQFALVILWGGLMGVIWLKTENIMLLAVVGIVVSATITGLSETAMGIGMLLLAVSFGILIFQMVRQRVSIVS